MSWKLVSIITLGFILFTYMNETQYMQSNNRLSEAGCLFVYNIIIIFQKINLHVYIYIVMMVKFNALVIIYIFDTLKICLIGMFLFLSMNNEHIKQ